MNRREALAQATAAIASTGLDGPALAGAIDSDVAAIVIRYPANLPPSSQSQLIDSIRQAQLLCQVILIPEGFEVDAYYEMETFLSGLTKRNNL